MTRTLRPFAIARAATASRQPTLRPMAAALDTAREAPVALTHLRAVPPPVRAVSSPIRPVSRPASSSVIVELVEEAESPLERAVREAAEALRIRAVGDPG